jgi:excinuclease UvrABC nuclease subunit
MDPMPVRRRRPELDRLPHTVYEFYDKDDRPLYVGCTVNLPSRMASHASKHWWQDVTAIHATVYADAHEGYAAERDLITELQPFYNVQCTEVGAEKAREGHRRRRAKAAAHAES